MKKKILKNLADYLLLEQKDMKAEELITNYEVDQADKEMKEIQFFILVWKTI